MIIVKDILQLKFSLGLGLHSVTKRREGKNLSCQSLTSNIRLLQKHFNGRKLSMENGPLTLVENILIPEDSFDTS